MGETGKVIDSMIRYFTGEPKHINHFLKVFGFAKAIGEMEGLDGGTQEILEIAALTHDIGIKNSREKYGSIDGSYQQIEGPPEARKLLEYLGFDAALIDRVYWLIAHHHIYDDIREPDYQILVEADFLVNIDEGNLTPELTASVGSIFKTGTGKAFLDNIFDMQI